jgi:serine/threonine protein kinase
MDQDARVLQSGEILGDFKILSKLGQGAFGITYLALDLTLDCNVAIKEYFPREFAVRDGTRNVRPGGTVDERETFNWGLAKFSEEAQTLARLDHPNVVAVRRFFKLNGTAYLVMDYCQGEPLDHVIRTGGVPSPERFEQIFLSLLEALEYVHSQKVTHRDIKPSNIFIRNDGKPVLLDFGAARRSLVEQTHTVTSLATRHYAAFEQYATNGKQGPWTDIYGLAATMYFVGTGVKPEDSSDRILEDNLVPLRVKALLKYPGKAQLLTAIDAGLSVRQNTRPQSVDEWRKLIKLPSEPSHRAPEVVDKSPVFFKDDKKVLLENSVKTEKDPILPMIIFIGLMLIIPITLGLISPVDPQSSTEIISDSNSYSPTSEPEDVVASYSPQSAEYLPPSDVTEILENQPAPQSSESVAPTANASEPTPTSIPDVALAAVSTAKQAEARAIGFSRRAKSAAANFSCPESSTSYWSDCNGKAFGYSGSWKNDNPSIGVSADDTGTYSGEHTNFWNKSGGNGYGVFESRNNKVEKYGQFSNNKLYGYGVIYNLNGNIDRGYIVGDEIIRGIRYSPGGTILDIYIDGGRVGP